MDYQLRVVLSVIKGVLYTIRFTKTIFTCCWNSRKHIPEIQDDLLKISATKLAGKIRTKEIRSEDVVQSYINRIKEVNPVINAVAEERFEAALKDAKEIDKLLSTGSLEVSEIALQKPLFGVPVTIKENMSLKGCSLTGGCVYRVGYKATQDGEAVRILKEAGAIPLLVSTTPEYCITIETYTKLNGITRNPYNTLRTCGGSSGGEGALLGSGASVIGLGSDLAGSIRFPSAFNGVFGHKPTPEYISYKGHFPEIQGDTFAKCLVVGPMTRYAEDLKLLMKILTGNHSDLRLDEEVDLSSLNIFYMEESGKGFGIIPVQREIKEAISNSANYLSKRFNCKLSDVKFENLGYSPEICATYAANTKFTTALNHERNCNYACQLFLNMFGMSKFTTYTMTHEMLDSFAKKSVTKEKTSKYTSMLEELKDEMIKHLSTNGVFLWPVFPTTAFRHKEFMLGYAGFFYSYVINILGFPSTTVPVGFDTNGLPIGIQVIANYTQDRICFAVAKALEEKYGGWNPSMF